MSLLLSPILFGGLGIVMARLSKARRVWTRHGRFVYTIGGVFFVLLWLLFVSLMMDVAWTRPWSAHLPGGSGPVWMWSSGLLPDDLHAALDDSLRVLVVAIAFTLAPIWYMLGVVAGFWLFGRSPKQTGVLGLLR